MNNDESSSYTSGDAVSAALERTDPARLDMQSNSTLRRWFADSVNLRTFGCLMVLWLLYLLFQVFAARGVAVEKLTNMPWYIYALLVQSAGMALCYLSIRTRASCYLVRLSALVGVISALVLATLWFILWQDIGELGALSDPGLKAMMCSWPIWSIIVLLFGIVLLRASFSPGVFGERHYRHNQLKFAWKCRKMGGRFTDEELPRGRQDNQLERIIASVTLILFVVLQFTNFGVAGGIEEIKDFNILRAEVNLSIEKYERIMPLLQNADVNNPNVAAMTGYCLAYGKGVDMDRVKGVIQLEYAAQHDHGFALLTLYKLAMESKNYPLAAEYLLQAAEHNADAAKIVKRWNHQDSLEKWLEQKSPDSTTEI